MVRSFGVGVTGARTHTRTPAGGGAETKKKESYTACQVHTNHAQRKCKITQTSKIDDTATHKAADNQPTTTMTHQRI